MAAKELHFNMERSRPSIAHPGGDDCYGGEPAMGTYRFTENAYSELLDAPEPPRLLHSPN